MILLDTNVVVRLLVHDNPIQTASAEQFFGALSREEPGFLACVTMVELAWVLKRSYGFSSDEVLDALEALLGTTELEFEDGESLWRALLQARGGADFADALIADTSELFGCDEAVTFDRDAARLLGMRLLA